MLETPLEAGSYSLGNNAPVRDNQQETAVGWFTAILEGEGSLDERNKIIQISNTDLDIIEGCEMFLKREGIWFVRGSNNRKGQKPDYIIRISRPDSTFIFKLLEPHLQCRFVNQLNTGSSETTREPSIDKNWLAGIFEAEGSFSLTFDNRDNVQSSITLPNTNRKIIAKIVRNLWSIGCSWYIFDKKPRLEHHTSGWIVAISGMKRSLRFLRQMNGMWISRRNQRRTSLMKEFIDSRFNGPQKAPYSPRERQIVQSMTDLNK